MPEPLAAPHEPRLARALRELLARRRTAALATLGAALPQDAPPDKLAHPLGAGQPFVSMVPYAWLPSAPGEPPRLVIHVSALAAHTRNMAAHPAVALLVADGEAPGEPVHALQRLTLEGRAFTPRPGVAGDPHSGDALWHAARQHYLARFADAEPMTQLGDFRFVLIELTGARQVAGFGAARTVDVAELSAALAPLSATSR